MKSPEKLKQYVQKRLKKGYPGGELRAELLQQGYTAEAIEMAFKPDHSYTGKDASVYRALIVSAIIIIIGISRIGESGPFTSPFHRVWGMLMIAGGIIGFIAKLILSRNSKE